MGPQKEKLVRLKAKRDAAMREAEQAAFAYFLACDTPERAHATLTHEGVYCAMQAAGLFQLPSATDFSR